MQISYTLLHFLKEKNFGPTVFLFKLFKLRWEKLSLFSLFLKLSLKNSRIQKFSFLSSGTEPTPCVCALKIKYAMKGRYLRVFDNERNPPNLYFSCHTLDTTCCSKWKANLSLSSQICLLIYHLTYPSPTVLILSNYSTINND